MLVDARETLQRLCAERDVDFAGLSRLARISGASGSSPKRGT